MKLLPKARYFLFVPYVVVTPFLVGHEYLFPDYSSLPLTLSFSSTIATVLLMPWNLLFYALGSFIHPEGNLLPFIADVASFIINAYIFFRIGKSWEIGRAHV